MAPLYRNILDHGCCKKERCFQGFFHSLKLMSNWRLNVQRPVLDEALNQGSIYQHLGAQSGWETGAGRTGVESTGSFGLQTHRQTKECNHTLTPTISLRYRGANVDNTALISIKGLGPTVCCSGWWPDRRRPRYLWWLWNRENHELLVDLIIYPFKKARSCSVWNIHHLPLKGSGSVLSTKPNHSKTRRDPKPQIEASASAFAAISVSQNISCRFAVCSWQQQQQQLMHMASLSGPRLLGIHCCLLA